MSHSSGVDGKVDYWAGRWEEKKTEWHSPLINPNLKKYVELLCGMGSTDCRPETLIRNSKKTWFVPLCGKTKDLDYLLTLGFKVFAVEGVRTAIEQLDQECRFNFQFDPNESLYQTEDGKLKIFYGDLFKCPIQVWGPFDFVWDRGSLSAIDYAARSAYIEVMQRGLQNVEGDYHSFRYLLESHVYDRTKFPGPPRVVEKKDMKEMYSGWADFVLLDQTPFPENHPIRKLTGLGSDGYWATRWEQGKTGWHVSSINGNLMLYMELLTGFPTNNRTTEFYNRNSTKTFFVPLCGKTKDLAYLLSLGFKVFAVEGVLKAIETLDQENSFNLQFDEIHSVYQTVDGKLKIFYGDLFKCPIEKWGPFDFLWDRGSLIAVDYATRPAYIKIIQRSVRNNKNEYHTFRYLLETVEYDRTKYPGPPRVVQERDMIELYSNWAEFKFLEKYPLPDAHNIRKIPEMGPDCDQSLYLITPKK